MSIISRTLSAFGKLAVVVVLLGAFGVGLAGVVYISLSGSEIKVPEIIGKDFVQSEKELASLGLKIRKRADRVSTEPMNTVLDQLPKAGETVKTGQWISVVVSKAGLDSQETPSSLKKDLETDDSETIGDMISDKPKKKSTNSNTSKKKADTTRDVLANTSVSNSATNSKPATEIKPVDDDKKDPEKAKDPVVTPKQTPPVEKPKNDRP